MPRGDLNRGGDVCAARGKAHGGGAAPVDPRVTLVQRELERLGTRPVGTECGLQVGYERVDVIASVDTSSLPTRGVYARRHERVAEAVGPHP
jgi:hypothetical protein